MAGDNAPATVEALLRSAAAADAAGARALLARIDGVRLLELAATQAELAVDGERPRPAGIDAVGDLARAAIEVMDLPQDASLDLEEETFDPSPPTVTGWELVTVEPDELEAATMTAPVPSWPWRWSPSPTTRTRRGARCAGRSRPRPTAACSPLSCG